MAHLQKGVTTGSPLPNLPELTVEPVVLPLHMVGPERIPLPVEVRRPQVQHRLGPVGMPTHPGSLQTVLDQMPTRPLDHTAADRIARRQVLVVTHPTPVSSEVADDLPHRLATGPFVLPLRQRLTQPTDDVAHLPVQEHPQAVLHPLLGLGLLCALLEQAPGHL